MLVAVGLALVIMYVPGLAILNRFSAFRRIDGVSRLCIAPGVSASVYMVLFALSYVFGIRLGPWTPWACSILALGSLCYPLPRIPRRPYPLAILPCLVFMLVAGVLLASRLAAVSGLVAPMWGDSVHHTIIVQLMLDNGGLFHSWRPYDEVAGFTYHVGFHVVTTLYAWMRGTTADIAVLMMGQIANFSAVLALYALPRLWTTNMWGGIGSVVIGGFISRYPFYFTYWGRYTQLIGHVVLIAALVVLSVYLKAPRRRDNVAFLVVLPIVIAGLGMAQYKVAVIFVGLAIPLVMAESIARYHHGRGLREAFVASLGRASLVAGLAVLIFMTRGYYVLHGPLGESLARKATMQVSAQSVELTQTAPLLITIAQAGFDSTASVVIWGVVALAVGVALFIRRDALWFPVGVGVCLILMNPRIVGIRRDGFLDDFHMSLTIYIVAASMCGLAIGTLAAAIPASRWSNSLAAICCLALTWFGVTHLPPLPLGSVFVLPDDLRMMEWIKGNVPPGEKIVVLGFVHAESFAVGRDAGWWIPFYTGRRTNLIFMAAGQEVPYDTLSRRSELALTKALYTRDMSLPVSTEWFRAHGYRYFYIGAKPLTWKEGDGPADHSALVQQLARNPDLKLIHQSGDARLLEVER